MRAIGGRTAGQLAVCLWEGSGDHSSDGMFLAVYRDPELLSLINEEVVVPKNVKRTVSTLVGESHGRLRKKEARAMQARLLSQCKQTAVLELFSPPRVSKCL